MSYCILFWGPSIVSRAFLAVIKTHGVGPFSLFNELLHTVLGSVDSFEGISGIHEKLMDLVLSRSFMSYYILFRGPSIVSRTFLEVMKTRGFGTFSLFYELLHTVLGSVDSFAGISGSPENSWIWSFLAVL